MKVTIQEITMHLEEYQVSLVGHFREEKGCLLVYYQNN